MEDAASGAAGVITELAERLVQAEKVIGEQADTITDLYRRVTALETQARFSAGH